jgi:nicotinamide riboside transporter PnuC
MDDIFRYYATDWLGMIATLLAVWLLGNKNKYGFVSFIISNVLWIVVGVLAQSSAITIGNFIFLIINVRGLLKWQKSERVEI